MAEKILGKVVGSDGLDATINGVNTLNIIEGDNISLEQTGSNLKISSSGGVAEAPLDNKQYGRQNGTWTEIIASSDKPYGDRLNVIADPHFELGDAIITDGIYPLLMPSGNASASIEDGILSIKSTQATAKGFQAWASFPQGWADKFNVVDGSKVTIGAYIKIVPANRDTFELWQWGAIAQNNIPSGEVPYAPGSQTLRDNPPLDDFVWFQWTVTMRQGGSYRDINDPLLFGLAYLQCLDPGASTLFPTTIQIKDPCIIFNATGTEQGFYETYRTNAFINSEVIKTASLIVDNFRFKSLTTTETELDIENATIIDSLSLQGNYLKLKTNYVLPTDGNYIGYVNTEPMLSESGIQYPIANKEYTLAEWEALSDEEKAQIGLADIIGDGTDTPVFTPVYTLTQWNALTEAEKNSIAVVDVVED